MRVVLQINDEDYVAFNIAYQFKSADGEKSVKKYKILYALMIAATVLLFLLWTLDSFLSGKFLFADAVAPLVLGIYTIVLLATFKSRICKRIRKKVESFRKEGSVAYDSEATLDFTDEMIMEYTPRSTTRREWSDIKRIIVDDEHCFLLIGAMRGIIIPFRCLEDVNSFMNYILQKTGLEVIR